MQISLKKTKFQRTKSYDDKKSNAPGDEVSSLLEVFSDSFATEDSRTGGEWVRAKSEEGEGKPNAHEKRIYAPVPKAKAAIPDIFQMQEPPAAPVDTVKPKKNREMHAFFEEIKEKLETEGPDPVMSHDGTSLREKLSSVPYFFDAEDDTTNICVGNLATQTTEADLEEIFGQYGACIISVKIMWPRNEGERIRSRNTGFVLFADRKEADYTARKLVGTEIHGNPIRLSWAKSVSISPATMAAALARHAAKLHAKTSKKQSSPHFSATSATPPFPAAPIRPILPIPPLALVPPAPQSIPISAPPPFLSAPVSVAALPSNASTVKNAATMPSNKSSRFEPIASDTKAASAPSVPSSLPVPPIPLLGPPQMPPQMFPPPPPLPQFSAHPSSVFPHPHPHPHPPGQPLPPMPPLPLPPSVPSTLPVPPIPPFPLAPSHPYHLTTITSTIANTALSHPLSYSTPIAPHLPIASPPPGAPTVYVRIPIDPLQVRIIDSFAKLVAKHGKAAEEIIQEQRKLFVKSGLPQSYFEFLTPLVPTEEGSHDSIAAARSRSASVSSSAKALSPSGALGCHVDSLNAEHESVTETATASVYSTPQSAKETSYLLIKDPEKAYYKWRVLSYLRNEPELEWSLAPFQLHPGGVWWIPPTHPDPAKLCGATDEVRKESIREEVVAGTTGTRSGVGSVADPVDDEELALLEERPKVLDAWRTMLQGITVSRRDIADAMVFILDNTRHQDALIEEFRSVLNTCTQAQKVHKNDHNVESAGLDVSSVAMPESDANPKSPTELGSALPQRILIPPKRLCAYLYIINDVIANSAVSIPGAWMYKDKLQTLLPILFERLGTILRMIRGRMSQQALKERVMKILNLWKSAFTFTDLFLMGLQSTFERPFELPIYFDDAAFCKPLSTTSTPTEMDLDSTNDSAKDSTDPQVLDKLFSYPSSPPDIFACPTSRRIYQTCVHLRERTVPLPQLLEQCYSSGLPPFESRLMLLMQLAWANEKVSDAAGIDAAALQAELQSILQPKGAEGGSSTANGPGEGSGQDSEMVGGVNGDHGSQMALVEDDEEDGWGIVQ